MFDKPMGGTELMYSELMRRLPDSYKEHFSIFNYIRDADFSKTTIYWNQLAHDQEAVQFLKDPQYIEKIDWFVFVSHWQAEQFRKQFGIPGYKTHVIKNASIGVEVRQPRQIDKIRLCYTSTPWRGLEVLLKAWEILQPIDCELHVFSSCKIYGTDFARHDSEYEHLYNKCNELPGVVYRGSIPNEELRAELPTFDILAYPCTFEETSCIAVIEALSAGLRVVTSSLGALPETTEGWANVYSYMENKEAHAYRFAKVLLTELEHLRRGKLDDVLLLQASLYNQTWNWNNRIYDWKMFLTNVMLSKINFITRNTWDNRIFRKCYLENEYGVDRFDENDVILDLGCHIGSFSKLAYDRGGRRIYAFEVSEFNYERALKNLDGTSVVLHKKAVWRSDEEGLSIVKFDNLVHDWNTGMGRIGDSGEDVECVKLDDVLSEFDRVRFLKIDIEGSEYPVLYTSKHLYKINEITGEYHDSEGSINGYGCNGQELKRFLEDQGFIVTALEKADWSNDCGFFKAIRNN